MRDIFKTFSISNLLQSTLRYIPIHLIRFSHLKITYLLPTSRLSMALFNIVSINNATNSNLIYTVKDAEELKPDLLCIQEIRKKNSTPFKICTLSSDRELAKANKTFNCKASSMIMNESTGIIIMNPNIQVKEYEINKRFTRIWVDFKTTKVGIPYREESGNNHRLIIYSVHVPPNKNPRKTFFEEDILVIQNLRGNICDNSRRFQ